MKKRPATLRLDGEGDRGGPIDFQVDGMPWLAYDGETVAGALFAGGRAHARWTTERNQPRGYYCGMGVCWECVMVIDGIPNSRACMTLVRPGMRVETQIGFGAREDAT